MSRRPYRPPELAWQMFRGTEAIEAGILTPHQLRSQVWRRIRHDVYADARIECDHALQCRAARMCVRADAVFAGPSAAYLFGVVHAAHPTTDVHVILPTKARMPRLKGLRVHTLDLDPNDVVERWGFPCTSPVRTAWDLSAWSALPDAVAVIDGLLAQKIVTLGDLTAYAAVRRGQRGSRLAAAAFALVDPAAQSAPESRLRVRLVQSGLPRPVPQFAIHTPDGLVLHPDLAWPEYRVALEYDGLWHAEAAQFHRDRRRLNQLVAADWLVLHVTSERLRDDFAAVVNEVQRALSSRGWSPRLL